jgi:hypothetical protein
MVDIWFLIYFMGIFIHFQKGNFFGAFMAFKTPN